MSGLREGKGETAFYDLSKDTIELTGHPTLTDKVKGVIEGDNRQGGASQFLRRRFEGCLHGDASGGPLHPGQ